MTDPVAPAPPPAAAPAGRWFPPAERPLWLLFLLSLPLINPYVRGDGVGYYAYVRSAVIDGDLDFENEFRRGDPAFVQTRFDAEGRVLPEARLPNGRVNNQWAVGPSLLWSPFFLAAHGLVKLLSAAGVAIAADGYSGPYRWSCAFGTAFYGFAALLLGRRLALGTGVAEGTRGATLGIWAASSLPVYMYFLPFQAHAAAAFTVALFLAAWMQVRRDPRPLSWILWGLSGGLMVETYYLDGVFLAIPLLETARLLRSGAPARGVATGVAAFGLAAVAALLPHFWTRWTLYGDPLAAGYAEAFFWTSPRLLKLGFSAEHGLFLWTPILLAAAAGLVLLARRQPATGAALAAVLALFYYVAASYQNWHGQSAFGSRFFVSFTAPFVAGLAVAIAAFNGFRDGRLRTAGRVLLVLLALWNAGLIFQWASGLAPRRGPVDIGTVVRNQVTEVPLRAGGFLIRYFGSRDDLQKEVERQDLEQLKSYRWSR